MPPIPIYSQSPINAAKASEVTPCTEIPSETTPKPSATTAIPSSTEQGYPAPQPGVAPSLPLATEAAQRYAPVQQPTPTSKPLRQQGPPLPQPGAAPVPSGAPGAVAAPPRATQAQQPAQAVPYPPQMAIPAPTGPFKQRGTMTAGAPPSGSSASGNKLPGQQPDFGDSLAHPPGYQQDINASEFSGHQRTAHDVALISSDGLGGGAGADANEGMWNSAMKWAQAAGEKLSAAETEVWKKINKE